MVMHQTIAPNDYYVPHENHHFKATAPAMITKTKRDYFWLLPMEFKELVPTYADHRQTGFNSFEDLKETLRSYFSNMVLKRAEVKVFSKGSKEYTMKNIRCTRASQWLKLVTEYRVMEWKIEPPNPLTHTDESTVKKFYAAKGCEDRWQATKRCYDKYYEDERLR